MSVLARDRATQARNGDLVVFAVNGFALASWMSRIPDVRELLQLTPTMLSLLLLSLSVGSIIGLPIAGRIAHHLGAATTVRLGMASMLLGSVLAAVATQAQAPFYLVAPGVFLLGFGTGVWDIAQNLEGTIIERAVGRAIMPWFHAAFSGGTVAAALIGAGMTALRVPLVVHLGTVAALVGLAALWGTAQFLPAFDDAEPEPQGHAAAGRSAWTEPRTLLIGVMVLAAGFAEGTANDWLAVAFVDGHHLDNAMGVVALAVFLSFMTAGRLLGASMLDRYGRVVVLRTLFIASIVGCLLVVFGNPVLAFIGAAIWGVGASLGFPVGMSAAADEPARAPMRISVVSTIGYCAFLAGPPLLGLLGESFGILRSLLLVGAMAAAAILVVPAAKPPAGSTPVGH